MRLATIAALIASIGTPALVAQHRPTLRERVVSRQGNISLTVVANTAPVPFAAVLDRTDVIVRARVGQATAHLSDDEQDIYTTYELINPTVLSGSIPQSSQRPGVIVPTLTVSILGGSVTIEGFTASVRHDASPRLIAGMDVVLLLRREGKRYWPATDGAAFSVVDSKVVPLARVPGEHERFKGQDASSFASELVGLKGKAR